MGKISEQIFAIIIYASNAYFTFPMYCFLSKSDSERFKAAGLKKSIPKLALFDPRKN